MNLKNCYKQAALIIKIWQLPRNIAHASQSSGVRYGVCDQLLWFIPGSKAMCFNAPINSVLWALLSLCGRKNTTLKGAAQLRVEKVPEI
jgi:hypothetical protein